MLGQTISGSEQSSYLERESNDSCVGHESNEESLIVKYTPLVRSIVRPFYLTGGDSEDLFQEGLLGLLSAIRSYDASKGASLKTYAAVCIRRRIISVIRSSAGLASESDITSMPLAIIGTASSLTEPEELFLAREKSTESLKRFRALLSATEFDILRLYLTGLSYRDIAEKRGSDLKSVDNAIQRIRRKLAKIGETSES
ncbi:MAG: sigma-70 family RNA polymerase sigma factor [Oscillospiraceae bacterium]|nr:sigma-70 family RNA polymerase sigma factor [Oscillospiraceae bacterium]